ncbi:MAG: hypothetical protein IPN68_09605 [Bacteroidetes bacterium]|nr:hypothetical protein [Bacteroidota bacterium]
MDFQNITLVPVGYIEEIFLKGVVEAAGKEFCLPVTVKEGYIDITEFTIRHEDSITVQNCLKRLIRFLLLIIPKLLGYSV